jgi:hypothetical protein
MVLEMDSRSGSAMASVRGSVLGYHSESATDFQTDSVTASVTDYH